MVLLWVVDLFKDCGVFSFQNDVYLINIHATSRYMICVKINMFDLIFFYLSLFQEGYIRLWSSMHTKRLCLCIECYKTNQIMFIGLWEEKLLKESFQHCIQASLSPHYPLVRCSTKRRPEQENYGTTTSDRLLGTLSCSSCSYFSCLWIAIIVCSIFYFVSFQGRLDL